LESQYSLNEKWIKVRKEKVKLPSGKILNDFYVVEGNDLVAVLAIDKGCVLLVRQYRHAVKDVTLDIPGGGVNPKETPINAARRELLEETGFTAGSMEKLAIYYPDSGRTESTKHIYLASQLTRYQPLCASEDDAEEVELVRLPINKLINKIKTGHGIEPTLCLAMLFLFLKKYNSDWELFANPLKSNQ